LLGVGRRGAVSGKLAWNAGNCKTVPSERLAAAVYDDKACFSCARRIVAAAKRRLVVPRAEIM